ncbi:MAG: DNA translocase FtsK [Atopobiaceae bacterium]|nr:DNA translocase FtsK [Atopobiaceae bacterium]
MPQKRRQNAAKDNARARAATPQEGGTSVAATEKNDIAGIALAIVALALLVTLVVPTTAVVTQAIRSFLSLSFGMGAILCPLSVLLYALSFFVGGNDPLGGRAALGLLLVCLSILSALSVFVPGAPEDPSLVLDATVVQDAGGYVGGGIAWALLTLVGKPVGVVLLAGLAIVGVIVCGFSVSELVVRLRAGATQMRMTREAAREQREAMQVDEWERRTTMMEDARGMEARAQRPSDATSFIGGRTTSVLTRPGKGRIARRKRDDAANDDVTAQEPVERDAQRAAQPSKDAKTRVLAANERTEGRKGRTKAPEQTAIPATELVGQQKKRRPTRRKAAPRAAEPSQAQATARKGQQEPDLVVPDFLKKPKKPGKRVVPKTKRPGEGADGYELPPLSMLSSNPHSAGTASSREELEETMTRLQGTLHEFGLQSRVVDYISGPIVTTFRVEMGEGERVSRIRNLEDDIALTLAAEKVRIFAPIPGTSFVGIEIPNKTRQNVHLGDVLPFASGGPLEVAIGRDSSGTPVVADISKMPHMLVAGTTGSGKSVMINSMIMSLLMRTTPKQVRLIMIDPKRVEFSCYNGLPHLYVPVVTEPRQAASALQWAVSEMERRLKVFERAGAREINVYNRMIAQGKFADEPNPPEHMPYLVVIIDELSDLMMVAGKDVEASIVRIAQLARAAGIHLVIATQRPSANVVTGLIKSNIDNRVALKVSSGIDSRVILDETGAERLLGNGDMLFKYRGLNMQRVLGCYTSDNEINEVVEFIRDQAEPDYHEEILSAVVPGQTVAGMRAAGEDDDDPLVWEAAQIVVESKLGSTSGLQRRLKVGYARAGRIMDMLEAKGVVGPPDGSKPREVLLDKDGLEELRIQESTYREVV